MLAEKNIGSLPVVDDDGKLLGILRDDDLIASEARVHVPTFINFLGLGWRSRVRCATSSAS